jgi:hypothetical protein
MHGKDLELGIRISEEDNILGGVLEFVCPFLKNFDVFWPSHELANFSNSISENPFGGG